ncbi:MAG: MFS transporter, partial [Planctomycetia bacterium]|nr:MFS transporter [Planctomycetia bacterium]
MQQTSPPPDPPLPPTIRGLGWTSFLTDLSSEAIYPLLPAFVMRELGGSAVSVGLLDGIANLVTAVVRLPAGALSDRLGRRPLILLGYGLSALVRPLMGLVATPLGAVVVRAADRFGKGIRTAPRDALVADLVPVASRGRAFGHIRALDHAGAALGPLVAMLFLLLYPGRERTLFLLTLLPGIVTLAVIWRLVRDPPRITTGPATTAPTGRLDLRQWPLLGSVAVWALGASSEQFLLLRAADLGVPQAFIPLVWLVVSFVKSVTASRAGRLSDRREPRTTLAAGWLLFAAGYAGLAASGHMVAGLSMMLVIALAVTMFVFPVRTWLHQREVLAQRESEENCGRPNPKWNPQGQDDQTGRYSERKIFSVPPRVTEERLQQKLLSARINYRIEVAKPHQVERAIVIEHT